MHILCINELVIVNYSDLHITKKFTSFGDGMYFNKWIFIQQVLQYTGKNRLIQIFYHNINLFKQTNLIIKMYIQGSDFFVW